MCVFPSLDCIVEKKVASQRPIVPSSPVRTGIKNTKMLYLRMPKPINGSPGRGCAGKTSACSSIIKPDAKPHFKPSGPSTDPNSYNKARNDTECLKTSISTKPTLDGKRSSTNASYDASTPTTSPTKKCVPRKEHRVCPSASDAVYCQPLEPAFSHLACPKGAPSVPVLHA